MQIASNNFYYPAICHFCKDIPQKLQRCSSCKTVAYCSREHQKLDWRYHKDLCKVITFTATNIESNCSFKEWKNHCINTRLKWSRLLNRQLYPYECQMWMFPRVCAYCFSQSNLKDCSDCLNVAYCSEEHREKHSVMHKRYCKSLRLCLNVDLYLAKLKSYPEIQLKQDFNFYKSFPKDMRSLLAIIDSSFCDNIQDIPVSCALKSEALTFGTSMIFSMQLLSLPNANQCIIHVVGVSAAEGTTDWTLTSELLFHSIPDLTEITYYLIGPEAWNISYNIELCETCNCSGKKVHFNVETDLYHEVVFNIEKPHFIFAFNSGFHEFEDQECDQWHKSIPFLISNDIPLIFTSYTKQESLRDLMYLNKIISEEDLHIIKSTKNPFSSLRPIRDWCTENVPVFYANAYITIVKK